MQTVLSKAKPEDLSREPFPHLVIPDALDEELCDRLVANMPSLETLTQGEKLGSNRRFSLGTEAALRSKSVPTVWREFLAAHTTQQFLEEFLEIFEASIRSEYVDFEDRFGPLSQLRADRRGDVAIHPGRVRIDAQISVNTPVKGRPSSVRKGHVDRYDKMFAGLLYLRTPDDDSVGGDLEIYRFKGEPGGFVGKAIADKYLETVRTVPYRRNTLVLFLNGPTALHGVSERRSSRHCRYFVNLVGELSGPLFDLTRWQTRSKLARCLHKLRKRTGESMRKGF